VNLYLTIPLLTIIALFQTVVLARVELWGARPNLMLLVVLIWSIVRNLDEGLVAALIGGLILDLFSGGPPGLMALGMLAAAFLAGQEWGRGVGFPIITLWFSTLISVLAYHVVLLTVLSWTRYSVDWVTAFLYIAAPSALLNAVLAPFIRPILSWWERRTRRERSFVL
jgi:rod shape-determining protein MreD